MRQGRRILRAGAVSAACGLCVIELALSAAAATVPPPSAPLQAGATATQTPRSTIGGGALASPGVVAGRGPGVPAPPAVAAGGAIVADLDTGAVLAAEDPHGRYAPASTLKVLTALVMAPRLRPTQTVLATSAAVNVDGSKVGVVPGHAYTVSMLFTGMLVVSGNDATRVLSSALGGDDAVVALMNAEARTLQANDTVAGTVTGLDAPGQTTSAYDLALIGRAALRRADLRSYVAIDKAQFAGVDVPGFQITSHNLLLGNYPGAYGVKNGFTDAARASYVGAAVRGGHHLMVTLLRTDPNYRLTAQALLDWGFAADGKVKPVGTLVDPVSAHASAGGAGRAPTGRPFATRAVPALAPKRGGGPSNTEYALGGAGAALVAAFFGRRRQVRRRRLSRHGGRKLTLPRI